MDERRARGQQCPCHAFPFTVPPGTYFVFARVDATGVVPEGDEANEFVLMAPTLLVH